MLDMVLTKVMVYLPVVLAVIGAASVAVKALDPIVKSEAMKARLARVVRALEMLSGLLGKLALNPKAPSK